MCLHSSNKSEEEDIWLLSLLLLLGLRSTLIKLDSAHGATIMVLQPVGEASTVERMLARQLATVLSVFALFETDVAFRFFAFLFLRQVADIAV